MNLANNISVLRLILVPIFVGCLLYWAPDRSYLLTASIFIFLIACISDAIDGYIARRFNQETSIGRFIDPIADKLLLVSGFLSLSLIDHLPFEMHIPAWLTISVIARDIIILLGSAVLFFITGSLNPEPSIVGKVTTFFQMLTLFVCLLQAHEYIRLAAFLSTAFLTIFSGVQYIRIGGRLMSK